MIAQKGFRSGLIPGYAGKCLMVGSVVKAWMRGSLSQTPGSHKLSVNRSGGELSGPLLSP